MRLWFSFEKSLLFNVGLSYRREKPEFIGAERLLHLFLDLLTYLTCCLWLLYFRLQTEFMPSQLKHKEYKKGDIHYRICGIWNFSRTFWRLGNFYLKFSRTFWHLGNFLSEKSKLRKSAGKFSEYHRFWDFWTEEFCKFLIARHEVCCLE